jgi:hypothetical protein
MRIDGESLFTTIRIITASPPVKGGTDTPKTASLLTTRSKPASTLDETPWRLGVRSPPPPPPPPDLPKSTPNVIARKAQKSVPHPILLLLGVPSQASLSLWATACQMKPDIMCPGSKASVEGKCELVDVARLMRCLFLYSMVNSAGDVLPLP